MSKITRRCGVRDIAPSTHLEFSRPNPSTLPSWVSASVSNRLIVLVLAAGLSGPPRRPTTTRIVGSSANRSASLVSSWPARRLYTDCLRRPTNRCCTLRPPRLSCRHSLAVSVSPSASSSSRQASSPASEVMVAPRNSNRTRRSKRSLARGWCFHPLGASRGQYVIKSQSSRSRPV